MAAESVMPIEQEEVTEPDYNPTDPALQKWACKEDSLFISSWKMALGFWRSAVQRSGSCQDVRFFQSHLNLILFCEAEI